MKSLLFITLIFFGTFFSLKSQDVTYGQNETAGKYVTSDDAKICYEVYGKGKPIVLIHGGFGYLDSFKEYIPILSEKYKVIAIASRGYGKSEIGNKKYTYDLLADDVKKVIEKECTVKAILIGHSDGAMISYLVAYKYPDYINKVIAMGGPLGTIGYENEGLEWLSNYNVQEFDKYRPDLKLIMPQPERWNEFSEKLEVMWSTPQILDIDELNKISNPVLLLFGDRDLFCSTEHIVKIYDNLLNAQLAIFPNSGHTKISFKNTSILKQYIIPFIEK